MMRSRTVTGLKGVRVAVCEEASNSDTLNEAALKKLVGTEVITSRELYKAFVTFETTQLVS
jgi:phage/plasmid-associated DNA primase